MEGSSPELRIATPADADRLDTLMKASAAAIFPSYYDERQTASSLRYVATPDPMLLEDGTFFILEAGDDVVACGGWSRRRRPYAGSASAADDWDLLDPATEAAHVRAMFVRADWTRRGLGRRILVASEAAARAEGFRRLSLVATLPGIPLYRAFGFEPDADIFEIALVDGVVLACQEMSKDIAPVASAD